MNIFALFCFHGPLGAHATMGPLLFAFEASARSAGPQAAANVLWAVAMLGVVPRPSFIEVRLLLCYVM